MKNRECLRDIKVKYLQKMIGDYYFMRNDALILEAADFGRYLRQEERAESTVKKYLRDLQAFLLWLDGRPLNKEATAAWKEQLLRQSYAPATINSMLAALNTFLRFTGRDACRVKFLKLQRRLFRDERRELKKEEFDRLLETARRQAPALYEQIYDLERYRHKAAEELITHFETNVEAARKYFLGEAELSDILPFVKEWRKNVSGIYGYKNNRLELLRDDPKMQPLYRRAGAMEGLLMHGAWFRFYMFDSEESDFGGLLTVREIGDIFRIFQEEQVPVLYQLDVLA